MDTVLTMGVLLLIVIIWFDWYNPKEVGKKSTSNPKDTKEPPLLQKVEGIKKLNHPFDKKQHYFPLLKGLEYNPAV